MKNKIKILDKVIQTLFFAIIFLTPILIFPNTSEMFEFNKMVFVYLLAIAIGGLGIIKEILTINKTKTANIYLKDGRTIFTLGLSVFLASQLLTTLTSIDKHISVFGYFGRFNGGLLSTLSYTTLAIIYIRNMQGVTKKALKILLVSSVLVSTIAIIEHFGVSLTCIPATDSLKNVNFACWHQDFESRVFSTLGQPNWLAAWIAAIIPITWTLTKTKRKWIYLSGLLFAALIFTKSKSGMVGFAFSALLYALIIIFKNKNKGRTIKHLVTLSTIYVAIAIIFLYVLKPSPTIGRNNKVVANQSPQNNTIVITDSVTIRKIVWQGAIRAWNDHKLFGSGVETFALSYPRYKLKEQNLTSEWDFVYNKAHNEFLNILANSGIIGLLAYLTLIASGIWIIINSFKISKTESEMTLRIGILIGYISLLITSTVGFLVVPTSILFYLFPAMAITISEKEINYTIQKSAKTARAVGIGVIIVLCLILINTTIKYWTGNLYFAKSQKLSDLGELAQARESAAIAIEKQPNEFEYWNNMSDITSDLAVYYLEKSDTEIGNSLAKSAILEADTAIRLSPRNVYVQKNEANTYIKLAASDSNYMQDALTSLKRALDLSPTDPKITYNVAIAQIRTGDEISGKINLEKAISLKENFKDPRYALSIILINENNYNEAQNQLEYIIKNIDPFDQRVQQELIKVKSASNQ